LLALNSTLNVALFVFEPIESADYSPTASPSSGTISASNTQSTHTFEILNDTYTEAPQTFFINITISETTPPSLSATANPDRATVRIIDDDSKFHRVARYAHEISTDINPLCIYSSLHQF